MNVSQFIPPQNNPSWNEELSEHTCCICGLVTVPSADPVLCENEHLFCRACIESHQKTEAPRCPVDGGPLSTLRPSKRVARFTRRLKVRCGSALASIPGRGTPQRRGCAWRGTVDALGAHEAEDCDFGIITCNKCEEQFPRRGQVLHDLSCQAATKPCPLCKQGNLKPQNMQAHLDSCPKAQIPCPNGCLVEVENCLVEHYGLLSQRRHVARVELGEHLKTCPLEKVSCPFESAGCTFSPTRSRLEEHLRDGIQQHLLLMLGLTRQQPGSHINGSHVGCPQRRGESNRGAALNVAPAISKPTSEPKAMRRSVNHRRESGMGTKNPPSSVHRDECKAGASPELLYSVSDGTMKHECPHVSEGHSFAKNPRIVPLRAEMEKDVQQSGRVVGSDSENPSTLEECKVLIQRIESLYGFVNCLSNEVKELRATCAELRSASAET